MFAIAQLNGATPGERQVRAGARRAAARDVRRDEPGYHLNKRHWLTVTCGGADVGRARARARRRQLRPRRLSRGRLETWTSASRSCPTRRTRAGRADAARRAPRLRVRLDVRLAHPLAGSYPLLALAARETRRSSSATASRTRASASRRCTASAYATLQDISDGRMVMGIGRGDSSRRVVGLKPVQVAEFEAACAMIKEL